MFGQCKPFTHVKKMAVIIIMLFLWSENVFMKEKMLFLRMWTR